jgi:potassium voltage-gated channel Eag-related subfamily H protein 7
MTRKRNYIIPHNHWFIRSWDFFIILLALYNSITLPLQLSFPSFECYFERRCPDTNQMGPMWLFDTSVDVFFFCDIIIRFLTTYMDTRLGDEIYQPSMIIVHYMKGSFTLDFISVLPPFCSLLLKNNPKTYSLIRTLSIFKLIRVTRISRLIETMNASLSNKTYAKMALIFYWIMLLFHILACLLKSLFFTSK